MTNIAMWSGPRNISTAMMYAFGSRADCIAWDEPFYGFYLNHTGTVHPMGNEIIAANECDWNKLVSTCTSAAAKPIFYQKHMTHHMLPGFDRGFVKHLNNAFLIRSPEKVLASYVEKRADVSLQAIGIVEQAEIFEIVANDLGHAPPVIEGETVQRNPRGALTALCQKLNIVFDEAMLQWAKGPKPFDGVWAPHWYNAAWASTQFDPPQEKSLQLSPQLQRLADQAQPYYERLKAHAMIA
jgi:Sulfotransferase domain